MKRAAAAKVIAPAVRIAAMAAEVVVKVRSRHGSAAPDGVGDSSHDRRSAGVAMTERTDRRSDWSAIRVNAIALNTYREAIRSKILYSILFFAFFVVGIAAIFGAASIGNQMKFVKDFSLMSISLFGVTIAIVLGVNLLNKELGKKTIFNILSKPVARWEFIVGKFAGLFATLTLIMALMCVTLTSILALFEGHVDWGLVLASGMALMELMVITGVALFFSAVVVTPALSGLFAAAVFIAGRSSSYLQYFMQDEFSAPLRAFTRALYWVLPHLDRFNIADQVVYGDHVDFAYLFTICAYAIAYSSVLLLLSVALFARREFP
jgi:ABC-type transport system involved in multi-copper enzyme maturation permease subunit